MSFLKRSLALSAVFALLIGPLMTPYASAAFFEANDKLSLTLPFDDDLYAAGGQLTVDDTIAGDAIVAGGMVDINGTVEQDLLIAGGLVTVDGDVQDDVRAAGGEVTIHSTVSDDLIVMGGKVYISESAVINGDVIASGGKVTIDGVVKGMVKASADRVKVNGSVEGGAMLMGSKVVVNGSITGDVTAKARHLMMGDEATLGANLNYWTKDGELDLSNVSIAGEATFNPNLRHHRMKEFDLDKGDAMKIAGVVVSAYALYMFLSAAILILVFIAVTKNFFVKTAQALNKKSWPAFLHGLAFFVLVPVLSVGLMFTVVGIPLALVLAVVYCLTLFLSSALSSVILAYWSQLHWKKKSWSKWHLFGASLVIYVLLSLLCLVPVVGWVIRCLLVVVSIGALLLHKQTLWKKVA